MKIFEFTLCWFNRCSMTPSRFPCHLQDAPGHGQWYGRYSQISKKHFISYYCNKMLPSWATFLSWRKVPRQPLEWYLHGKKTVAATFSIAKFRIVGAWPRHVGQCYLINIIRFGWAWIILLLAWAGNVDKPNGLHYIAWSGEVHNQSKLDIRIVGQAPD